VLLAPLSGRYVPSPDTFPGLYKHRPGRKRIFVVTCLLAANVVIFLLNEICKLNQMWLFLNVLYVTAWSLIKFYVIIF